MRHDQKFHSNHEWSNVKDQTRGNWWRMSIFRSRLSSHHNYNLVSEIGAIEPELRLTNTQRSTSRIHLSLRGAKWLTRMSGNYLVCIKQHLSSRNISNLSEAYTRTIRPGYPRCNAPCRDTENFTEDLLDVYHIFCLFP